MFGRHRVVEEHHEAIPGEMLENPAMRDDELSHCAVVLAQDSEDLLGFGLLGESGEPAQITEADRDRAPVAFEQLRTFLARDEMPDLRREEARELRALPFHRFEKLHVRDRD